jgi:hypothetical protein
MTEPGASGGPGGEHPGGEGGDGGPQGWGDEGRGQSRVLCWGQREWEEAFCNGCFHIYIYIYII